MATTNYTITNSTTVSAVITSMNGLGTSTASRAAQGVFIDFGVPRAANWLARLQITPTTAPTAGTTVDLYMAWATATATTGNFPAGVTGTDIAYTGPDTDASKGVCQLDFIGSIVMCATAIAQIQNVGMVYPKMRYGAPVIFNNTATGTAGGGVAIATSTTANALSFTSIDDQSA